MPSASPRRTAVFAAVTVATLAVHPLPNHAALAGIAGVRFAKRAEVALAASSAVLIALMASVAVTIFPSLLPAYGNVRAGLDIYNAAPNAYSLGTAFTAAIVGFGAALLYGTLAARRMLGKRLNVTHTE